MYMHLFWHLLPYLAAPDASHQQWPYDALVSNGPAQHAAAQSTTGHMTRIKQGNSCTLHSVQRPVTHQ